MPRLIDADALTSILEEWEEKACDGTENDGSDGTTRVLHPVPTTTREMIDLIADQPTIAPAPQWIPVMERLPEKTGTYIVTTAMGAVTTARFYEARSIQAQKWREAYDRPASWQSNRKVTRWMPLPKPPEMGGGNDHADAE